jgi:hypothetical protein
MNTLRGTALIAMGRECVISRDIDAPSPSPTTNDDYSLCWTNTALTVLSLVVDPLSILGFPIRLSGGMAIPDGALHTTQ